MQRAALRVCCIGKTPHGTHAITYAGWRGEDSRGTEQRQASVVHTPSMTKTISMTPGTFFMQQQETYDPHQVSAAAARHDDIKPSGTYLYDERFFSFRGFCFFVGTAGLNSLSLSCFYRAAERTKVRILGSDITYQVQCSRYTQAKKQRAKNDDDGDLNPHLVGGCYYMLLSQQKMGGWRW